MVSTLLHIGEVLGLTLGPETVGYHKVISSLSRYLKEN